MPVVSVLMVFHRDTPYLRPAIASVLRQTWRDWELVLVDNGTGLTAAALGIPEDESRVRWVRLETNVGIAAGHNAGVSAARGEFIALLDYDDIAEPCRLEKQVAALRTDPSLGLVSGLAGQIDEQERLIGRVFCLADTNRYRDYAVYAAPVITPAAMGRRAWFEALPYRGEFPFAADLDFQVRLTEQTKLAVVPEMLLRYRVYTGQTTQQKREMIEKSRASIGLLASRRRAGRPEGLREWLELSRGLTTAEHCWLVATTALREGFGEMATYWARRSLVWACGPKNVVRAIRLVGTAWFRAPRGGRARVLSFFLRGPVKALGVRNHT